MYKIIACAKLPFQIDKLKAQEEVTLQLSKEKPHFNTAHYTGEWTVISLRSPGGNAININPDAMGDEVFEDTELMLHCTAIKTLLQSFKCRVMSVRLLNLKTGAVIKEHKDAELSFEKGEVRLHIPLFTNEEVEFYVEGKQVVMREGECWYINANLPHRVSNFGKTDRIHLVIDCKVNNWLQKAFTSSIKSYSKDDNIWDQKMMTIRELRLQNTETSNQLAGKLEEELNTKPAGVEEKNFLYWLPYKVVYHNDDVLLQWLYVNNQPFTDPFFDETISKCKRLSQNKSFYKPVSGLAILKEWADAVDSVKPAAFIFHVSRCGSTLVSQLLAMKDENISLSEVPVFDQILRMPFKRQYAETTVNEVLAAAIKLYGSKRKGNEKRLFIKTDSWHLLFYKQVRALYPSTPFIILYRNPSEVLFSQQRQKGMHAVRGVIEPAVFGFDTEELGKCDHQNYMLLLLEKYFEVIVEMAVKDNNCLLINYSEGISNIMEKIAGFVTMELTDFDKEMFLQRSRYHAKNSKEIFAEKYSGEPVTSPNLNTLENLYKQIEKLRVSFNF